MSVFFAPVEGEKYEVWLIDVMYCISTKLKKLEKCSAAYFFIAKALGLI